MRTPITPPDAVLAEVLSAAKESDPYPGYRHLQREYPVAPLGGPFVSLSRYADVAAALRHPQASTDDRTSQLHQDLAAGGRFAPAYLSQLDDRSLLHRDPPDHTRLRKLAAKAFTPRRVEALRGFIERQARNYLLCSGDVWVRRGMMVAVDRDNPPAAWQGHRRAVWRALE